MNIDTAVLALAGTPQWPDGLRSAPAAEFQLYSKRTCIVNHPYSSVHHIYRVFSGNSTGNASNCVRCPLHLIKCYPPFESLVANFEEYREAGMRQMKMDCSETKAHATLLTVKSTRKMEIVRENSASLIIERDVYQTGCP
jgi:hypothetical protein